MIAAGSRLEKTRSPAADLVILVKSNSTVFQEDLPATQVATPRELRGRVLALVEQALDIPFAERPAFLEEACGEDADLRRQVESLLSFESAADGFLPTAGAEASGLPPGTRIGPYRIVELLGRGGMGSVYKAEREDDFKQQVALKLVPHELASPFILRRFHLERRILARLDHPNIARLLDGGTTNDGRPYLVMEHVEGVPIDQYCEERRLSARERLELILPVCSALAFAHQNLVVHRDIKPGNILVTEEGVPKLLDFGIAKLLDPEEGLADLTRTLERPMTLRYASPEQVRAEPVTPASDLYGLGVLLYQLLTGRLPCDLDRCGLEETARRICEQEPLRPSALADSRHLAGDVDAIVLKALRKEPRHRYSSVEQLAEDVRRHLAGHPVQARKGTVLYRGGKFLRRHRWGLAAALMTLVLLGVFLVREQRRWHAEQQRTARVIEVLRGLLNLADPDQREDPAVVQVLDRAHRQLADLKAEPDLQAELLGTLGGIHLKLGNREAARQTLTQSIQIWRQNRAGDPAGLAVLLNNLGALDLKKGEHGRAERLFRQALELQEEAGTVEPEALVVTLNNLATVLLYRGELGEAEALYRRGLAIRVREHGRDDPRVSYSLRSLGAVLYNRGDLAAAEPLLREALRIRLAAYGPDHTDLAPVLDLLGNVRFARGDQAEAKRLYTRALDLRRRRLGSEHVDLARSERNLAALQLAEGNLKEARRLLESALARLRKEKVSGDWQIVDAESLLGALLMAEGRRAEGGPILLSSYRTLAGTRGGHAAATREARLRLDAFSQTR